MRENKVKELRQQRGLTQIQLANLAGVSVQWIQKIEQGWSIGVSIDTQNKICSAMGVSRFELFPELRRELEIFKIVKSWLPDLAKEEETNVKEVLSRMSEEEIADMISSGTSQEFIGNKIKKAAKEYRIAIKF